MIACISVLTKKHLLNQKEFALLRSKGKTVFNSPFFNVTKLHIPNLGDSKFGFVVSNKVDKRAVVRNRIKRVLADSVRRSLKEFEKGFFIGFYVKPEVIKANNEEITNMVNKAISKVSLT